MTETEDFLRRHPLCCFCGGSEPASTIDRQPGKILFPDQLRPLEMELPACASCSQQARADEALLALVCRFIGSPRRDPAPDSDLLRETFATVRQRFPGLLERMDQGQAWIQQRGQLIRQNAINVNQPEVRESMCRLAAKLALAIYYQSNGAPAGTTCRIKTLWSHCQNPDTFQQVTNLIRDLPRQANLKAGTWTRDEDFFSTFVFEGEKLVSMSIFREAVALVALLQEGPLPAEDNGHWDLVMAPVAKSGISIVHA
jgi:hypothetical protein